jgi:hypothetical protein
MQIGEIEVMKIEFIKNIQFTKLVKTEGRLREFNFRKINGIKEGMFTVDVSEDRGNRIIFTMQRDAEGWKIVGKDPVPEWIMKNETTFSELIEEELKNIV